MAYHPRSLSAIWSRASWESKSSEYLNESSLPLSDLQSRTTSTVWNGLSASTGSTGLLQRIVVKRLLESGPDVAATGLVRPCAGQRNPDLLCSSGGGDASLFHLVHALAPCKLGADHGRGSNTWPGRICSDTRHTNAIRTQGQMEA